MYLSSDDESTSTNLVVTDSDSIITSRVLDDDDDNINPSYRAFTKLSFNSKYSSKDRPQKGIKLRGGSSESTPPRRQSFGNERKVCDADILSIPVLSAPQTSSAYQSESPHQKQVNYSTLVTKSSCCVFV